MDGIGEVYIPITSGLFKVVAVWKCSCSTRVTIFVHFFFAFWNHDKGNDFFFFFKIFFCFGKMFLIFCLSVGMTEELLCMWGCCEGCVFGNVGSCVEKRNKPQYLRPLQPVYEQGGVVIIVYGYLEASRSSSSNMVAWWFAWGYGQIYIYRKRVKMQGHLGTGGKVFFLFLF